jgi:pimeloyl-ACP methyl ester carboxylesterase
VVVHGLGANKLNQLLMAAPLRPRGFNVLAIDLRAHGDTTGQFTTFAANEWQDVAAAVRWARVMQPRQSEKVVGVGASLGAAAMLIAAADSHPDHRLDAIGVFATYATLPELARDVSDKSFPPPLNYLARYVALPLACVHCGANLYQVSPVDAVRQLPRTPLMIIHGRGDRIIDPANARRLFDAATGPRELILLDADHNAILEDCPAAQSLGEFLSRHAS